MFSRISGCICCMFGLSGCIGVEGSCSCCCVVTFPCVCMLCELVMGELTGIVVYDSGRFGVLLSLRLHHPTTSAHTLYDEHATLLTVAINTTHNDQNTMNIIANGQ